jgi:hypothetical protein
MQPPELGRVAAAQPAVVALDALYVLAEEDLHQLVDVAVGWVLEEGQGCRHGAPKHRLVLLHEDIGPRQGAQKAQALQILLQGGVEAVPADELDVVRVGESEQPVAVADALQARQVVEAEVAGG